MLGLGLSGAGHSGALALKLPVATTAPISMMDALFTSTSAITVTGLSVIDVETGMTFWGQLILIVLVQLGGLGLMSFAVLVFSALGMPIGLRQQTYLREDLNQTSFSSLTKMVAVIIRVVIPGRGSGRAGAGLCLCAGIRCLARPVACAVPFGLGLQQCRVFDLFQRAGRLRHQSHRQYRGARAVHRGRALAMSCCRICAGAASGGAGACIRG